VTLDRVPKKRLLICELIFVLNPLSKTRMRNHDEVYRQALHNIGTIPILYQNDIGGIGNPSGQKESRYVQPGQMIWAVSKQIRNNQKGHYHNLTNLENKHAILGIRKLLKPGFGEVNKFGYKVAKNSY